MLVNGVVLLVAVAALGPMGSSAMTCKYDLFFSLEFPDDFVLLPDEFFCAPGALFGLDTSGELVFVDTENQLNLWSAGISATPDSSVQLINGNLVVVSGSEQNVVWESGTRGVKEIEIFEGKVHLTDDSFKTFWTSGGDGGGVYGGGGCQDLSYGDYGVGLKLRQREYICQSENLIFGMDNTGDLALIDVSKSEHKKIWSARTAAGIDGFGELLEDGRLVVWSSADETSRSVLWDSNTIGNKNVELEINEDYDDTSQSQAYLATDTFTVVWSTRGNGGGVFGGGACVHTEYELNTGARFQRDEFFCDQLVEGNLVFGLDSQGDLVFLDVSGEEPFVMWSAGTQGRGMSAVLLQTGDLVVYGDEAETQVIWASGTHRNGEEVTLEIALDENDVRNSYAYLHDANYNVVWWTLREGGVHGNGLCLYDQFGMGTGAVLLTETYMCFSGNLIFGVDATGDLALLDVSGATPSKIWSAGTGGNPNAFMYFNPNGNVEVREFFNEENDAPILWQTNTKGTGANEIHVKASAILKDSYWVLEEVIGFTAFSEHFRSDGGRLGGFGSGNSSAASTKKSNIAAEVLLVVAVLCILVG